MLYSVLFHIEFSTFRNGTIAPRDYMWAAQGMPRLAYTTHQKEIGSRVIQWNNFHGFKRPIWGFYFGPIFSTIVILCYFNFSIFTMIPKRTWLKAWLRIVMINIIQHLLHRDSHDSRHDSHWLRQEDVVKASVHDTHRTEIYTGRPMRFGMWEYNTTTVPEAATGTSQLDGKGTVCHYGCGPKVCWFLQLYGFMQLFLLMLLARKTYIWYIYIYIYRDNTHTQYMY